MDTQSLYILLGLVVVGAIIWAVSWLLRPRPQCPECYSHDVSLIKKEPQKMNASQSPATGGEGGGARFTASVFYRVRYRCNVCQETWEKDMTESR